MMARRSFLSIAASLGGALALAGCDKPGSGAAYRYRLTLDVETPEGAKTGSSVIEVRTWETHFEGKRTNHEVRGQAVVVDLGARGLLFALLAGRGENGGLGSVDHAAYLPALVALRGKKLRELRSGIPEKVVLDGWRRPDRQGNPISCALSRHR